MRKYPFVKQEGMKDCGCASMLMIIKYYKGNMPIEKIREMTKTTKKGTTAYHIIQALKEMGFEAKGIKCKLNDINKENIILPCIAHVIINNSYRHYIVIYEINFKKETMLVADPSCGIKKISFKEFNEMWDNILITLYPIKNIPLEKDTSILSFTINILKIHKKLLFNIIILSLFVTLFSIVASYYLKNIIDNIDYSKNRLLFVFIIFLIVNILKIITDYFRNKLLIYINQKIDLELTNETFKKIILLPYNYYHNRTTGEIISRINDLGLVKELISKSAISIFIDFPLALISLIFLYSINTKLFLITILILISYIIIIMSYKKILNKYINKIQNKKEETTSYMIEGISGFETVKGINIENKVINKFEKKYVELLKNNFKFDNHINNEYLLKEIIYNIGLITIIFIGSILVFDSKLTLGSLLAFNSLLSYFLDPIRNIVDLDMNVKEAKNSLKRVLNLFFENKELGVLDKIECGDIVIKNLNYSFNDKDLILKNINLTIKKKEKVMIIGKSGSGKSTLLKILMKYYKVERGNIEIGGNDYFDIKEIALKKCMSYISQNEILFTDTILNNLKIDNRTSHKEIIESVKTCCMDEIVNNHLGLNMLIEENGFNISGGEKQRIVLARTLLQNKEILLIDEGLNQVDINLERKILKNILKKYKDKTIIIISHRLENLDLFDHLIEIENGVIIKDVMKNR